MTQKTADEEIRRLQGSINDLTSIQALPAIWNGRESGHITSTLLDVLASMLRLDFAYARLSDSINGSPVEFVRLTQRRAAPPQPQEIGRALDRWLTNQSANAPLAVPNPAGDGEVRIAPARQLHEQNRAAEELERRVADRTAQLTTVNEALRESEKKYRTLFDSIDEGFCTIEVLFDGNDNPIDYRFLEVNPSFEKQTGIQNAQGRRMREIAPQHEEHWFEIYGRIALTGEPVRFENQAAQLHRWYDVYAFRVGKPGDRKVAILFKDITERKRAEEELRQKEVSLREAQTELAHVSRVTTMGELAASIAHEVNQPLTSILTNASAGLRWLSRDSPNLDEACEAIRRIIRDGNRAGDVISRMRALFKKASTTKERLDINEAIEEVVILAQSEVQRNRVSLQTKLANDLPLILGDRIQLQQVILNLLMNAIEAMSGVAEGPRELGVSSEKVTEIPGESKEERYEDRALADAEWTEVLITVRDSGPGLDPQRLNRLFDAFYTTKPQGLGMGLAISRSIIEAHGGRLCAKANVPQGAVFQFTLPIRDARIS
jgi:PAS domain S-box-containing protein